MENSLKLKRAVQSVMFAGVIVFSAAGVVHAAGAGEQTGEYGDMTGHGKGSDAPEPRGYQQSGGATSGQGTSGQGTSGQRTYEKPYDQPQGKPHDKRHDKSYDSPSGQGGGSSGQSGGGGGY